MQQLGPQRLAVLGRARALYHQPFHGHPLPPKQAAEDFGEGPLGNGTPETDLGRWDGESPARAAVLPAGV